jgi:hypothetical protein
MIAAWCRIVPAVAALVLMSIGIRARADEDSKPSATLCRFARQAREAAGSEVAAERMARARHVSEATIASAKRCPR